MHNVCPQGLYFHIIKYLLSFFTLNNALSSLKQWTLLKFALVFCYGDSFLNVQLLHLQTLLYVERAMQWIGHPKKLISLFERLFNGYQWLVAGRPMCAKHSKGARSLQELASKALRTWSCHNDLSNQPHTFQLEPIGLKFKCGISASLVVPNQPCCYFKSLSLTNIASWFVCMKELEHLVIFQF